jgi:site-specific recombinase XerD
MCLYFLSEIEAFDIYLHDMFLNQYNTGLRYTEIFELSRWTYTSPTEIVCMTAKNNLNRTFSNEELSFMFVNSIIQQKSIYETCRYTTAARYWNRYFPYPRIMCRKKQISTHLFRHNKSKLLKDQEWTDEQIQNYFGEQNILNTMGYIYSTIYIVS